MTVKELLEEIQCGLERGYIDEDSEVLTENYIVNGVDNDGAGDLVLKSTYPHY